VTGCVADDKFTQNPPRTYALASCYTYFYLF